MAGVPLLAPAMVVLQDTYSELTVNQELKMKPYQLIGPMLAALLAMGLANAQGLPPANIADEGPEDHVLYRPGDVEWQEAPDSLEPGAEVAILEGNPAEPGFFTMRIKMPDGYVIAPHWHPNVERLTVISGMFFLGAGQTLDEEAAIPLEPGTYTSMPPEMYHYAFSAGETVIQLTSIGPWEINYVNPQDDPRQR